MSWVASRLKELLPEAVSPARAQGQAAARHPLVRLMHQLCQQPPHLQSSPICNPTKTSLTRPGRLSLIAHLTACAGCSRTSNKHVKTCTAAV